MSDVNNNNQKDPEKKKNLKVCHCCGVKVNALLDDFSEIGWSGFKMGRGKVYCFCPDCQGHTQTVARHKLLESIHARKR